MRNFLRLIYGRLKEIWQNKTYRLILNVGIITLSLSVIGFLLYRNWNELSNSDLDFDYRFLIAAIISYGPAYLFTAAGWDSLLRSMSINVRLPENLKIYSLSSLPKHIPGVVFYAASRVLQYQELGVAAGTILAATVVEAVLLSFTGFIIALGLLFGFSNSAYSTILWIAGILSLIFLLFFNFFEKVIRKFIQLILRKKDLELPEFREKYFQKAILNMFLAWIFGGIVLFFSINVFTDLSINKLPWVISIWAVSGATSLSIGAIIQGFGIREITMGALLSTTISPLLAVVVALGFRIIFTIAELIWVGITLLFLRRISRGGKKSNNIDSRD